jgi:Flp pilus assembly protein TadD
MRHRATYMMERIVLVAGIGLLALVALACGGETEQAPVEAAAPAPSPALLQLEEMVRRNPDDVEALHALAVALHTEGRPEQSVERFQKLVEMTGNTRHMIELGVACVTVGKLDEAETAFMRALETTMGHPVALHHLGNLSQIRGDMAAAISFYRQAVESDPQYLMAHFHLAEALLQTRQLEHAYRSFENVVNLEPRLPLEVQALDASLLKMAEIDLQMGAPERAVEFLNVLVAATPDHPTAHLLLGQALMELGRPEEARQELEIHERLAARQTGSPPAAGSNTPGTEQVE